MSSDRRRFVKNAIIGAAIIPVAGTVLQASGDQKRKQM